MTFAEWLVEKGYCEDTNTFTVQSSLSSEECDILYEQYLEEGY